ncbi:head maturation protease, ClpP-related [Phycicoccus jejuensis]|uniref:head maturation protease, ClpP-related n=1 Tax=Phycicoccus jejuensis TaxID=367299 RepID=UPI000691B943|nr:head maturation protease, ClpP-related [Phycicoccus jejuensis]
MPDDTQLLATQRQRLRNMQPLNAVPPVKVTGSKATIRIYQDVDDWGGPWGLSATELTAELDALGDEVDTIELRINSYGGSVFEAVTMMNALRSHSARVVAVVEGLAASAASFLAVSADETVVMPSSRMMLHAAWGVGVGNATDLRALADLLDNLTLDIAEVYAAKTGEDAAVWLDRLQEDRWYSAQEAVDAGLADRIEDTKTPADTPSSAEDGQAHARFDPSLTLALLDL